jgi:hypothetical protein
MVLNVNSIKSDSTLISGTLSDLDGKFKITNVPDGSYFIQFSQTMDYIVNTRHFRIEQAQPVQLTIQMQLNPNLSIQEVHIKADRMMMGQQRSITTSFFCFKRRQQKQIQTKSSGLSQYRIL